MTFEPAVVTEPFRPTRTALTVVVPVSVDPAGAPAPRVSVTGPEKVVVSVFVASTACRMIGGARVEPAAVLNGGCCAKTMRTGSIARPVAWKETGEPVRPVALAVSVCCPTVLPSRQLVLAWPFAPVTTRGTDYQLSLVSGELPTGISIGSDEPGDLDHLPARFVGAASRLGDTKAVLKACGYYSWLVSCRQTTLTIHVIPVVSRPRVTIDDPDVLPITGNYLAWLTPFGFAIALLGFEPHA